MNPTPTISYYRLIALWVICEAFVGGLIHGLHLPVSGLLVGGAAVACISLIGWYHPSRGSILRATLVVMIFKMLLSPQAPVTAYVAVLFQGALGELLFRQRKYFKAAVFVFAIIALLESAFQRFLILTIIYGSDVWTAINFMLNKLTGQQRPTDYSLLFILGYTAIHLLVGILLGYGLSRLPHSIEAWKKDPLLDPAPVVMKEETKQRRKSRWGLWLVWGILLLLLIQSEWGPGASILPLDTILPMLIRSVLIVSGWILLIGPMMNWLLHHWLRNQQGKLRTETEAVMSLLPETHQLLREAVSVAAKYKGWKKLKRAIRYVLVNALEEEKTGTIYLLCAPKGSGKSSSLRHWSERRKDVHGILSPVLDGKRMFLDIDSQDTFPMEAGEAEAETLAVGKYIFSRNAFDRAITILEKARHLPGWLIIDEVGPLELRGEGLNEVVLRSIRRKGNTIIVIREGLEEQVKQFCQAPVKIIRSVIELPIS